MERFDVCLSALEALAHTWPPSLPPAGLDIEVLGLFLLDCNLGSWPEQACNRYLIADAGCTAVVEVVPEQYRLICLVPDYGLVKYDPLLEKLRVDLIALCELKFKLVARACDVLRPESTEASLTIVRLLVEEKSDEIGLNGAIAEVQEKLEVLHDNVLGLRISSARERARRVNDPCSAHRDEDGDRDVPAANVAEQDEDVDEQDEDELAADAELVLGGGGRNGGGNSIDGQEAAKDYARRTQLLRSGATSLQTIKLAQMHKRQTRLRLDLTVPAPEGAPVGTRLWQSWLLHSPAGKALLPSALIAGHKLGIDVARWYKIWDLFGVRRRGVQQQTKKAKTATKHGTIELEDALRHLKNPAKARPVHQDTTSVNSGRKVAYGQSHFIAKCKACSRTWIVELLTPSNCGHHACQLCNVCNWVDDIPDNTLRTSPSTKAAQHAAKLKLLSAHHGFHTVTLANTILTPVQMRLLTKYFGRLRGV
ncbi:hypothetical protein Rhopal_004458-T1 [Rhodotorula paludigena]|uniref:Uncharacterized protein n=1 Tax=Rhodotorula paludigena TaxID=86838 RepID=A0AAV5GPG9_9BASI|nr:hypothetical protein Rhopal_004458-T1 [Rhodotorula paludigena]